MSKKKTKISKGKRVKTRQNRINEKNISQTNIVEINEKNIKRVNKKQKSIKRKNKLKKKLQSQRIQQKRNNEEKVNVKQKPKKTEIGKNIEKRVVIIINIIMILVIAIFVYLWLRTKFKNVNIKLGTQETSLDNCVVETAGECNLSINWILEEMYQELGQPLDVNRLVLGNTENESKIPQSEIDKVDTSVIGKYEIRVEYEGKEYISKIIVQDTTPPELELKNITIYDGEKIGSYTQFIKSVSDISGEPSTSLKTEIDYSKVGEQEIVIEAVDVNGNRIEKTAILTIIRDTSGPVISGLSNMSIKKNSQIDYYSGVSAVDEKYGVCEVTVDSSNVNVAVAGTYYATYISKDKEGNTTKKTRKIVVEHDQSDTDAKFEEFYSNYCAGQDIVSMANIVRTRITYEANWGGDDPVWYGLTEGKGNCYVHTMIMQRCLQKAGYTSQVIYRLDKGHYWNLVYVDGVWRHLDSTPSLRHTKGLLTDEQKWNDAGLDGIGWDKSLWPAAE